VSAACIALCLAWLSAFIGLPVLKSLLAPAP
jgi:hypothetical protein